MLFPIRDSIAPRSAPVVNIGLIVASCLVFVYQLIHGSELERLFFAAAFIPARLFGSLADLPPGVPDYGLPGNAVTILASMFMHGGWLHIIGNMWFLYVFGDNVESALGHLRYLLFYLGGGAAAALGHAVAEPSSTVPTVGASGAIAAVLGAYLVMFPRSRVHTLVFLGLFVTVAELPALLMLGFWFALQFFQGALSLAARPGLGGVAWFAHVGGFVAGVAVAWWIRARGRLRQPAPRYQIWYRH
jgi:hypothetical protein